MHYLWLGLLVVSSLVLLFMLVRHKGAWQWLGYAATHVVIAAFLLYFVNLIGSHYEFRIPLNLPTVGTALVLGAPGVLLLVGLKIVFV
ncbi:pro-sigmaK processing inhibitor BofA family protein [Paenibacillus ginsengarvi]|nr:pro-sigmaK processing inhibitor BofA family protein [Paenibacillus ginsengarvi]